MGAVSLFRNLEPSGLLLANVWALPVRMWRRWQALMVR